MMTLSLKTLNERLEALESQPEAGQDQDVSALLKRIEMLEACLSKTATLSGNGNNLREFGLERWVPGKADMRKRA